MKSTKRLKHVTTMRAGGTPPVADSSMWAEDGLPWVAISDMTRSSTVTNTERRVSFLGIKAKNLPVGAPGTILFAMYASVGALGVLQTRATWNQAILGIEPIRGLAEPRFVSYWLRYMRADLESLFRSNTQDNLNADQVANIPFSPIPFEGQRAIADFLDAETARIDALITKKHQTLELLSERSAGIVERGVRDLAKRYSEQRLKTAVGDITVGIVVTPSVWYSSVGIPALRGLNVRPHKIDLSDLIRLSTEGHRVHAKSKLRAGDVVVVRTGQAGAAAVVPPELDDTNCIDLLIIRPGSMDAKFLAYVLNSDWTHKHIGKYSVGTIQSHFNVSSLAELPIPAAPLDEQRQFVLNIDAQLARLEATQARLRDQLELLCERRQALITAAVTGEMDVPGVPV